MTSELKALVREAGCVLIAWFALIAIEHLTVGFGYRALFAGTWEMAAARNYVTPICVAALVAPAIVVVGLARLAEASTWSRVARTAIVVLAWASGALVAFGVSGGRHFDLLAVRVLFVAVTASLVAGVAHVAVPGLALLADERPRAAAALGLLIAVLAWTADAFVLPRLYPAFHEALFALALVAGAAGALVVPRRDIAGPLAFMVAGAAAVWCPSALRRLEGEENARLVLSEHAPWLGRGVELATLVHPPPPPASEGEASLTAAAPDAVPRSLDWTGRDIVVLSIDALRADHVGAYGYARPTTPGIDALAREGTLFESAYCPTPHTSYSVTSMMTGKYMRPLLTVGLGADSETWAGMLRRYGWRTAAFYPPAVFFIDESRFADLRDRGLDFEYRRVEFSTAEARAEQVVRYLESPAASGKELFLWVHLFEPHEPYVMHREHAFGPVDAPTDVDSYDSEIAAADAGITRIVDVVRKSRPSSIVILTADHGEEFGEHGGRYHGTTVYEEQVHVPLIVVGEGIPRARRIAEPVQTIDLLPTTLSALGIPRPARVRGRDLGRLLREDDATTSTARERDTRGLAFAETDDYTLVARGRHRLVCARRAGACALYDPRADPRETRDLSSALPDVARELRTTTAAITGDQGRFETGAAHEWPEALRRGMQGDVSVADDVATLLEDVRVDIRRKAAEVTYELHAVTSAPQAKRAATRTAETEDETVRRYAALALVRMGEPALPLAEETFARAPDESWRRRAALAFAERGDDRGNDDVTAWWNAEARKQGGADFERARVLLDAMAKTKNRTAVPFLVRDLSDVRLRPFIADALGTIGDLSARGPLLAAFAAERYVTTRPHEGRALAALGARAEMIPPLTRFAGVPEPMLDAIRIAYDARILDGSPSAIVARSAGPLPLDARGSLRISGRVPYRLIVLLVPNGGDLHGSAGETPLVFSPHGDVATAEIEPREGGNLPISLVSAGGIRAAWLVPRAKELDPPPAIPWDSGIDPEGP